MSANDNGPEPDPRSTSRATVAALVAVVLVAAALFWVVSAIRQHDAVQNCLDSGRHDCVDLGVQ